MNVSIIIDNNEANGYRNILIINKYNTNILKKKEI